MADESLIIGDIGFDAGNVYRYLEEQGKKTKATDIKSELGISTSAVYLALGWLAREDQVSIYKKGNSVRVDLK